MIIICFSMVIIKYFIICSLITIEAVSIIYVIIFQHQSFSDLLYCL